MYLQTTSGNPVLTMLPSLVAGCVCVYCPAGEHAGLLIVHLLLCLCTLSGVFLQTSIQLKCEKFHCA